MSTKRGERTQDRSRSFRDDVELYEYLMCPDVYHGQPCGDGHTPEMVDEALTRLRAKEDAV